MINSEQFRDLFNLSEKELKETVLFTKDPEVIGFSIKKEYPDDIPFVVARTKNGKADSVALIHVGFYLNALDGGESKLMILRIAPASRYKLRNEDKFHYDYEDDDCPTKDSQKESGKSKQPPALEEHGYIFDAEANEFLFAKNKKQVQSPKEIIEKIFEAQTRINRNRWWDLRLHWFRLKAFFFSKFLATIIKVFRYLLGFYIKTIAGYGIEKENDIFEQAELKNNTLAKDSKPEKAKFREATKHEIEVFGTKLSLREAFWFLVISFSYYFSDYFGVRLLDGDFMDKYHGGLIFKTLMVITLIFLVKLFLSVAVSRFIVSRIINWSKDMEWRLRLRYPRINF